MKKKLIKRLMLLIVSIACIYSAQAEVHLTGDNASLNGYVMDSITKETLISATVSVVELKIGSKTNKSGFFSITNIPPGNYTVQITYIGYKKFEKKIIFKKRESQRETFLLSSKSVVGAEITVEADREVEKRQISISKVDIPISQIKEIRIGGESDVFRTIQCYPAC